MSPLIKQEILKFAQKVNEAFPLIPVNGMLAMWCKQENLPFSTFDELNELIASSSKDEHPQKTSNSNNLKTCQHMYNKG